MKKGFTLMEILAVLLLIAVILTLAVPVFRVVRQDMRNLQARAATQKLAEAINTYYVETNGGGINKFSFNPRTSPNIVNTAPSDCVAGASGVPSQQTQDVSQLFACGYLEAKDFVSLPYMFLSGDMGVPECEAKITASRQGRVVVISYGADGAGDKYQKGKGCLYVDVRRRTMDTYD